MAGIALAVGFAGPSIAAEPDSLPAGVAASLERHGLDGTGLSIAIADIADGETILDYQADVARNPASTMKLVTALAALETLTPSYRWRTRLMARAEPAEGVLDGDLYFVGGGDPYLVQERLWLLIQSLRRAGVSEVRGDLIVDDSYFAPINEDPASFDAQPFRIYNVVPSAALTNFNSIRFTFEPSPESDRVRITSEPTLSELAIENRLRTIPSACRGYARGISMAVAGTGRVRFDGRFPARCDEYSFTRSVLEPRDYTGALFRELWHAGGGTVAGRTRAGRAGEALVLLHEHESVSLGEAVRLMNKHSSNLIARHLLLTLGAERDGAPGTEEKGIAAIHGWLESHGLAFDELVIENGAGRSRDARVSARHLAEVVRVGWRSQYMPEFVASMALMGQDGTLSTRHTRGRLFGRAHMKTGRLDHVAAIAGVYHGANGRRYAVAILHNAPNAHRGIGEAVQDSVFEWLGSQSEAAN